jgi:hypothetical protein
MVSRLDLIEAGMAPFIRPDSNALSDILCSLWAEDQGSEEEWVPISALPSMRGVNLAEQLVLLERESVISIEYDPFEPAVKIEEIIAEAFWQAFSDDPDEVCDLNNLGTIWFASRIEMLAKLRQRAEKDGEAGSIERGVVGKLLGYDFFADIFVPHDAQQFVVLAAMNNLEFDITRIEAGPFDPMFGTRTAPPFKVIHDPFQHD